jgi:hypothetical protein
LDNEWVSPQRVLEGGQWQICANKEKQMNKRIRKKRTVYIVAFSDYDQHDNLAVYTNRKRAEKEVDRLNKERDAYAGKNYGHGIEEFIIQ